jgi:hypothetical protein
MAKDRTNPRSGDWLCACGTIVPDGLTICARCGTIRPPAVEPARRPASGPPPGPERRTHLRCGVHHVVLDGTGFCAVGQAYWYPKFRCPGCGGPLWDNGFCESCSPRTHQFMGHYFEQRWDDLAGREFAHYVLVHKGPTLMPSPADVAGYLAEFRALTGRIGRAVDATPATPTPTRAVDPDQVARYLAAIDTRPGHPDPA